MLIPIQTTDYAVRTVCTFQVAVATAASINARMYLHAGSHLGALTHGQPIPWDDDVDAFMDHDKKQVFYRLCKGDGLLVYPGVSLRCFVYKNAIKVWLYTDGMDKETGPEIPWYSPFLDVFLYKKRPDTCAKHCKMDQLKIRSKMDRKPSLPLPTTFRRFRITLVAFMFWAHSL